MMRVFSLCACLTLSTAASAQHLDPLEATIFTTDAERFATLFEAHDGRLTAEQLEAGYLADAAEGLQWMYRTRMRGSAHLAESIAADPEKYRRAIDVCLPLARNAEADLRVIYLGLKGLLPEYDLPEVHVVFGAGTAAGIAGPGVQVIGLEVICAERETDAEIIETYRFFFAHETIHVMQGAPDAATYAADPLLFASLYEGAADYVAMLVTGRIPDRDRDSWAREHEDQLWEVYARDREILRESAERGETLETLSEEARAAFRRWHFNAGAAPDGWPAEAGYWIGRQIVSAYVDSADDKHAAIRDVLRLDELQAILVRSGYDARLEYAVERE